MNDPRTQLEEETRVPEAGKGSTGRGSTGRGSTAEPDATSASDIKYYQHSAFARVLTAEATRRARRARREAIALIPVAAGLLLVWLYREDIFGTDTPVRIAAAILLAAVGGRFARDNRRSLGPRPLGRFHSRTAS